MNGIVKKGRGKGKKPALIAVSLRLDGYVVEFFNEHHSANIQKKMREVLSEYVNQFKEKQDESI